MSAISDDEALAIATQEIEAVHDFIGAWFRGEPENTDQVFKDGLADRLHAQLVNIQPGGQTLARADLLDPIRAAYGANPNFHIRISDVTVHFVFNDQGLILASYVEHQSGARNTTPADNDRVSTVLFNIADRTQRPVWLHIHETARATA